MNKVKGKSYQNMFVDTSLLQEIFQFEDMPEASAETVGKIYQYLGETNANFTKGYFYIGIDTETVETETDEEENEIEVTYHDYSFENINVQNDQTGSNDYSTLSNKPSINDVTLSGNKSSSDLDLQEIIQYSTMPNASADTVGKIVQYTGTTDSTYTNGFFYKGISKVEEVGGVETTTYSWKSIDVNDGLVFLSYGHSTWNDFIEAYNAGKIVYCKASSNQDPSTGVQKRFAFMTYINTSGSTITSVEFQYYRSVATHTASQQTDQIIRYILSNTNSGTWTVDTRETGTKIVAGTGITTSYSNGEITLNASGGSSAKYIINCTYNGGSFTNFNTNDNKEVLKEIWDNFDSINVSEIYAKAIDTDSSSRPTLVACSKIWKSTGQIRISFNICKDTNTYTDYGVPYISSIITELYATFVDNNIYGDISKSYCYYYSVGNTNYLVGKNNTSSWTPTEDYGLVHKKYVDDKLTTYSGYDNTKTQILKNVNGTLTWVDE